VGGWYGIERASEPNDPAHHHLILLGVCPDTSTDLDIQLEISYEVIWRVAFSGVLVFEVQG